MKKKSTVFNWKHCECGCKAQTCLIGNIWHYVRKSELDKLYYLTNCSYDGISLTFLSIKSLENHIIKEFKAKKQELMEQRKSINVILKALNKK